MGQVMREHSSLLLRWCRVVGGRGGRTGAQGAVGKAVTRQVRMEEPHTVKGEQRLLASDRGCDLSPSLRRRRHLAERRWLRLSPAETTSPSTLCGEAGSRDQFSPREAWPFPERGDGAASGLFQLPLQPARNALHALQGAGSGFPNRIPRIQNPWLPSGLPAMLSSPVTCPPAAAVALEK